MRAILFPGQGSQFIGMGSDFYKKFDLVKKNFSLVDEILGFSLSKIILVPDESLLEALNALKPIKIITRPQTTSISFVEPVVP